jgi:hypothetical protein
MPRFLDIKMPIPNIMKPMLKFSVWSVLAAAIAASSGQVPAQTTNKPAAQNKAAEKKSSAEKKEPSPKAQSIPFHGHILELNKAAKTVKVDKRIFAINSDTKIYKGEKPAALEEGIVGEYITGSYRKTDDGKLVARSIYFGGKNKEKATEKAPEKKKEK